MAEASGRRSCATSHAESVTDSRSVRSAAAEASTTSRCARVRRVCSAEPREAPTSTIGRRNQPQTTRAFVPPAGDRWRRPALVTACRWCSPFTRQRAARCVGGLEASLRGESHVSRPQGLRRGERRRRARVSVQFRSNRGRLAVRRAGEDDSACRRCQGQGPLPDRRGHVRGPGRSRIEPARQVPCIACLRSGVLIWNEADRLAVRQRCSFFVEQDGMCQRDVLVRVLSVLCRNGQNGKLATAPSRPVPSSGRSRCECLGYRVTSVSSTSRWRR